MSLNLALGEALTKAGIHGTISLEQVVRSIEKETEKKEKASKRPVQERPASNDDSRLGKMWEGEKSRRFMTHLLHSFLPFHKAHFPFKWVDHQDRKCCMCQNPLLSKCDILDKTDDLFNATIEQFRTGENEIDHITRKVFDKKMMAIASTESRSVFCPVCWEEFQIWVQNKVLKGDDMEFKKMFKKIRIQSEKEEPVLLS